FATPTACGFADTLLKHAGAEANVHFLDGQNQFPSVLQIQFHKLTMRLDPVSPALKSLHDRRSNRRRLLEEPARVDPRSFEYGNSDRSRLAVIIDLECQHSGHTSVGLVTDGTPFRVRCRAVRRPLFLVTALNNLRRHCSGSDRRAGTV